MDKGKLLTGLSAALWNLGGGEGMSPTVMMQMQKQAEADTAARLEKINQLHWERQQKQDRERFHREGMAEAYKYGPAYEEAYAKYDPNDPLQTAPVGHMLPQFQEGAATRASIAAQRERDKLQRQEEFYRGETALAEQGVLNVDQPFSFEAVNVGDRYQQAKRNEARLAGINPLGRFAEPLPPRLKSVDRKEILELALPIYQSKMKQFSDVPATTEQQRALWKESMAEALEAYGQVSSVGQSGEGQFSPFLFGRPGVNQPGVNQAATGTTGSPETVAQSALEEGNIPEAAIAVIDGAAKQGALTPEVAEAAKAILQKMVVVPEEQPGFLRSFLPPKYGNDLSKPTSPVPGLPVDAQGYRIIPK